MFIFHWFLSIFWKPVRAEIWFCRIPMHKKISNLISIQCPLNMFEYVEIFWYAENYWSYLILSELERVKYPLNYYFPHNTASKQKWTMWVKTIKNLQNGKFKHPIVATQKICCIFDNFSNFFRCGLNFFEISINLKTLFCKKVKISIDFKVSELQKVSELYVLDLILWNPKYQNFRISYQIKISKL